MPRNRKQRVVDEPSRKSRRRQTGTRKRKSDRTSGALNPDRPNPQQDFPEERFTGEGGIDEDRE
jgi:hypothetical protein